MGKKKPKPRKPKRAGDAKEVVTSFILSVLGGLVANLIESAVRKLLG